MVQLVCLIGCSNGKLEPWHTARLTQDFRAGDAETFAAYLAIEDQAFAELDEEVYAKVPTGPEFALVRYSRGSLSDPDTFPQNYNRSYELEAGAPRGGVLMIHGMSDSPYSMWAIGESLHEAGFHVVNLRLPGHGTAAAALTRARWQDFAAAVELAMAHLDSVVGDRAVHLIGFSNGAPVAVNYALDSLDDRRLPVPGSLILIAPAIGVTPVAGLAGFKNFLGGIPGLAGLRYTSMRPAFDPFRYGAFPTNGATQTHKLTRRIANGITRLEQNGLGAKMPPVLVVTSVVDNTVSNDAIIDRLLGRLPDNGNELLLFDVNRVAATSSIVIPNPGPFANRVRTEVSLPFAVTLVHNASAVSRSVVASHRPAFAETFRAPVAMDAEWPPGVVSLSHVGLTFAADDPLYGRFPPEEDGRLFLGSINVAGERGILRVPDNWFTRQRHNPFYDYMEVRLVEWCLAIE
ncbi:MAG: alpha/beta fold hydrolase [Pseudomonadota bacterium]